MNPMDTTNNTNKDVLDVVVIGAGVSGAAQFFAMAKYTNLQNVVLLEKESDAGFINSHATSNSQTLHEGDIETNYTFEKAAAVKQKSAFVRHYVQTKEKEGLFLRGPKMVLGIGDDEVSFLKKRFEEIASLYPTLEQLSRNEIGAVEPKILEGRPAWQRLSALYNKDGLTVNYGILAQSLLEDAQAHSKVTGKNFHVAFNTEVQKIERDENGQFTVTTNREVYRCRFVSVCAGAHSMLFAKQMHLPEAQKLSLLCVAGNFYYTPKHITTKVYTVQNPKLPFSAVHGDPDILDSTKTRFGPTTRMVFMLERHRYSTVREFFSTLSPLFGSIVSYIRILLDVDFFFYAIKHNILFQIPFLGNYLFMKEVRKIIPTVTFSEVQRARGQGGVRPQIVNTATKIPLSLGEAKLQGDHILFNVTPSPGATTCLYNGIVDTKKMVAILGADFLAEALEQDFGVATKEANQRRV